MYYKMGPLEHKKGFRVDGILIYKTIIQREKWLVEDHSKYCSKHDLQFPKRETFESLKGSQAFPLSPNFY